VARAASVCTKGTATHHLKDVDAAAIQLSQICRMTLDDKVSDTDLRSSIFGATRREDLQAAVGWVDSSYSSFPVRMVSLSRLCGEP